MLNKEHVKENYYLVGTSVYVYTVQAVVHHPELPLTNPIGDLGTIRIPVTGNIRSVQAGIIEVALQLFYRLISVVAYVKEGGARKPGCPDTFTYESRQFCT